jgi:NitT/TauT family transport system permease protein
MSEADLARPAPSRATVARDENFARTRQWMRIIRHSFFARRLLVLVLLAIAWQVAATLRASPILFPSFTATVSAFFDAVGSDDLLGSAAASLLVLGKAYVLAVSIALLLVSAAATLPFMRDVLQTLTAIFNPLPAIALLPLAMLWLGLGEASLLLVLVHSVLWPFALAALTGFEQVPETQRLVGRNYGLRGPRYIVHILLPAALPSILSGLKVAWAFAWRTLIASELVFGISSGQGGLGWFIYRNRNDLLTDRVFAGLATVILIGLFVEFAIFHSVERLTVERWGMQKAISR